MVLLADVGGLSGVSTTLASVKVPPDVIKQIVKILADNSGTLDLGRERFQKPNGTWFGGTDGAHALGVHAGKAHAHLTNSILEAVAGLQAASTAIETFDKEFTAADADFDEASRQLLIRTKAAVNSLDDDRYTPPVTPTDNSGSEA